MTEQTPVQPIKKYNQKTRFISGIIFLILVSLIIFASVWNVINQKKIALQQTQLQSMLQQQKQLKFALTEQQQLQQTFAQQISLLMNNSQQNQTQIFLQEISVLLHLADMELNIYHASDRALKILNYVEHRIIQQADKRFDSLLAAIQADEKILQQDVQTEMDVLKAVQQLQQTLEQLSITLPQKNEAGTSSPVTSNTIAPKKTISLREKWSSLEKFITIRRFDGVQPRVLDQQTKELLKQQLLSLSSLLSWTITHQQNEMFQQTLQQIQSITEQYFPFDQTTVKSIQQQVSLLQKKNVNASNITIDKTMTALSELENQLRKS